jgi:PAS domain-containing protein
MTARPPHRAALIASTFLLSLSAALCSAAAPARDSYIDLNASPLYARVGFDPALIGSIPAPDAAGWKMLPPAGAAGRVVRPVDLGLPGIPKRPPFSLASYPTMEFTYLIPFQAPAGMASRSGALVPGMHFAGLGDNWEIYLNGTLVEAELHLAADGTIAFHRSMRNVHFPVDGGLFREGTNILALRIVADPSFAPAGLNQAKPYYIDEYRRIERANVDVGPMVLIGLYVFIGLYHAFMFLVRTRDRHNLFYGLFSLDLGLYLLMRTSTINLAGLDSDLIFRAELVTLAFILPLLGAFLETLNDSRIKRISLWYGAFCALIALGELVMPVAFVYDLLRVWQLSGLIMAFYYFGVDILGRYLSEGQRRWKRERGSARGRSLARVYLEALVRTPIGNLVIGGFLLFGTAVFDIVDAVVMQWDLLLTKYGFFLFTMGTALILANRFGFLHERLSGLNHTLEERIRVLTETSARLSASERRYRSLFEGSSDPVALLTEDLAFIEGNRTATDFFALARPGRPVTRLVDAVYAEPREGSLPGDLLREAASSLRGKAAPRELSLRIKSPTGEPKSCKLRLERIDNLERSEILLRLVPEEKDALAEYFVEGRERFDVESSLAAADEVCRRATAYLSRYMDGKEARFLSMCLREMVLNAVEHGNLQIDFEEKSASLKAGRYFELLQERRLDPRFRSRRVAVEYSLTPSRATFRVTDEGPGFDHRGHLKGSGKPAEEILEHGRGILMTMSAFDKVAFNDKGNQVTLVKFFGKDTGEGKDGMA